MPMKKSRNVVPRTGSVILNEGLDVRIYPSYDAPRMGSGNLNRPLAIKAVDARRVAPRMGSVNLNSNLPLARVLSLPIQGVGI